jgi:hypothetical protein
VRKIAALAREGALSAASGDWARGSDDDSASNRDSIRGGGVAARKEKVSEDVAKLTEGYAAAISRTVPWG